MKARAPLIAGLVGLVVLGLVVIFVVSPKGDDAKGVTSPILGHLAPALQGETLAGPSFDLDRARGEWVLVNFFASWCPPCAQEHPELRRLSEAGTGQLQVVGVASQDSRENVEEFFEKRGGDWPVIVGDTKALSFAYGLKGLPESFLIDPSGTVVAKFEGAITAMEIDKQITELTKANKKAGS